MFAVLFPPPSRASPGLGHAKLLLHGIMADTSIQPPAELDRFSVFFPLPFRIAILLVAGEYRRSPRLYTDTDSAIYVLPEM